MFLSEFEEKEVNFKWHKQTEHVVFKSVLRFISLRVESRNYLAIKLTMKLNLKLIKRTRKIISNFNLKLRQCDVIESKPINVIN